MIVDQLIYTLGVILGPVRDLLNRLPEAPDMRLTVSTYMNTGKYGLGLAVDVLPWTGWGVLLAASVAVWLAVQVIRVVMWVLAVFHVSGDDG